jgi:hypothetical protein
MITLVLTINRINIKIEITDTKVLNINQKRKLFVGKNRLYGLTSSINSL